MIETALDSDYEAERAANLALSKEEFCSRFKAHMLKRAGRSTFDDGDSVEEYADMVAPTYFEEEWQREDGPEACASADMDEWE